MAPARQQFFSLPDEIWLGARDCFDEKTCRIPGDPELIRALTTPLYDPNFG